MKLNNKNKKLPNFIEGGQLNDSGFTIVGDKGKEAVSYTHLFV